MTHKLIYGKTIDLQADTVNLNGKPLGTTSVVTLSPASVAGSAYVITSGQVAFSYKVNDDNLSVDVMIKFSSTIPVLTSTSAAALLLGPVLPAAFNPSNPLNMPITIRYGGADVPGSIGFSTFLNSWTMGLGVIGTGFANATTLQLANQIYNISYLIAAL